MISKVSGATYEVDLLKAMQINMMQMLHGMTLLAVTHRLTILMQTDGAFRQRGVTGSQCQLILTLKALKSLSAQAGTNTRQEQCVSRPF